MMHHRIDPQPPDHLKQFSRRLRQNATPPERMLWHLLRNRRLGGYKFRRQQPIGPFIVDFFCEAASLVVELDGRSHDNRREQDRRRDEFLRGQGLRVLRIPNTQLLEVRSAVTELVLKELERHS